MTDKCRICL